MCCRLLFLLSLFFCFFISAQNISAQKFLALDKGGRIKRLHFFSGDFMRVKLKSTHQYIFGNLALVRDTLFVGEEIIKLSDIDKLKIKKDGGAGALLRGSAVMLPAAALLFIFTGVANSVINNEPPLVTENNAKLSAGFALGGVLLWRLSYRVFKINKHHALKIVDVSIR